VKRLSLVALAVAGAVAVLSAGPGPLSLSGKFWPYYQYTLAPESLAGKPNAGQNKFDLDRAYFGVAGDLDKHFGGKVNFDLARMADGYFHVVVKSAYFEHRGLFTGLKLQVGQHDLPWVGFEEKLWKFRYVGKTLADQAGKLTSTDLGISALYDFPSGYGGVHLALVNGNGWKAAEANKFKDLHGRLTIVPAPKSEALKGLKLSGFYAAGQSADDVKYTRGIGNFGYGYDFLSLGGTYLMASDDSKDTLGVVTTVKSSGLSFYGAFDFGKLAKAGAWGLFGKYDGFDPNTDKDGDKWTMLTAGLFWNATKDVSVGVNFKQKSYEDAAKKAESSFGINTEVNFKMPSCGCTD